MRIYVFRIDSWAFFCSLVIKNIYLISQYDVFITEIAYFCMIFKCVNVCIFTRFLPKD